MMPPTLWSATAARASAAPVTPTISSWASLSRVDSDAMSPHTSGPGAAGNGRSSEALLGVAAVGTGSGAACGCTSAAGEQAISSADNAVRAARARDIDMGPQSNGVVQDCGPTWLQSPGLKVRDD